MNLRDLQAEVGQWHREHFPNATATHIILKLVEEVGELAKAHNEHLLAQQAQDNDLRPALKVIDGIADIVIVLAALCEKLNVPLYHIVESTWREVKNRPAERVRS